MKNPVESKGNLSSIEWHFVFRSLSLEEFLPPVEMQNIMLYTHKREAYTSRGCYVGYRLGRTFLMFLEGQSFCKSELYRITGNLKNSIRWVTLSSNRTTGLWHHDYCMTKMLEIYHYWPTKNFVLAHHCQSYILNNKMIEISCLNFIGALFSLSRTLCMHLSTKLRITISVVEKTGILGEQKNEKPSWYLFPWG